MSAPLAIDPGALRSLRERRYARDLHRAASGLRAGENLAWPWLDLAVRLWLAQTFFVSGLLKLADWNTALALATHEYPVSWLAPASAALLGVITETVFPVLLAAGLLTRLAALPLLALTLVIEFEYRALPEHLVWALLFAGYAILGAGPLALDRLLARGLGSTALPLVRSLLALGQALTRTFGPLWWLAARAGLAWALFATHPGSAVHTALAALLVAGFATRPLALLAAAATVHLPGLVWLAAPAALLAVRGAGVLSADALLAALLARRFPALRRVPEAELETLPQVVIVGAGFGGLAAARALADAPCRVTVIDRRNYHLFQPLLYQVATAALNPADIATPIRELLRDQDNARVLLGQVSGVDRERREVIVDGARVRYDQLILATGARHSYFGRDDWEPYAPGLKKIDDATAIRRRILLAFEHAETCADPVERTRLLTFVVIGGGPTGVELAGAIAELARHGLAEEFRHIDPGAARVVLIQAEPRVLPTFPPALSAVAQRDLEALGVEVLTDSRVEQVDADGVLVGGHRLWSRTVFWAAGVMASKAAQWLGAEADRAGRLKVGPDLTVPGLPEVFAIGDTAAADAWDGRPVPGLAPAAKQGGAYAAAVIRARLEGRPAPAPFRYRHLGSLATVGRQSALADFGKLRLSGALAWWLWGLVHVAFLSSARNRVGVALQWLWAYLTFRRGTRLVTGTED